MIFRRLSDVAPPSASRAKPDANDTVWCLTLDQIESGSGQIVSRTYGRVSEAGSSTFAFDTGNVLYSKLRPYLNKVICPDTNGIATTELVPLRPVSSQLSREYLCYYLRSPEFVSWASVQVDGAKMPRMKMRSFWAHEIPVPPLDTQIRIAHLLGKVESLIAQRKQHLQQLDDLLKSVFLEMFGDPVRNEKGWDTGSLSSYGSFKNGLNFGKGESGATVRYLGVGDFKSKATLDDIDSLAFIELNELPAADYFLQDGDLLFVRSNGNRELVGRCIAVYPGTEKVTYSGFCIRYRINDPALQATYMAHLFRSAAFRRILLQGGQGANIQNINQQTLSGLPIPVPSAGLQNHFATIVARVEDIKSRYQQSLADLETLYSALSQQAFKGELDLSRVPLPDTDPAEEKVVAAEPLNGHAEQGPDINLPDSDRLPDAFGNAEAREALMTQWLEAYRTQLGDAPFSLQRFMVAAQSRLEELLPDTSFMSVGVELGANNHEHIKDWVFKSLAAGTLTQIFDETGSSIQLKTVTL